MRLPNVLPSGVTREFATTLDITATIVAAAGAPIPSQYQGFDLLTPIAAGGESPRKVGIACEYRGFAVVTPTWKLAYFPENDEGRLWNRLQDPSEQVDLWQSQDASTVAARVGLLRALLRWRAQQDPLGFMLDKLQVNAQGPSAQHVVSHLVTVKGTDAEERLNVDAMQFEYLGGGSGH